MQIAQINNSNTYNAFGESCVGLYLPEHLPSVLWMSILLPTFNVPNSM